MRKRQGAGWGLRLLLGLPGVTMRLGYGAIAVPAGDIQLDGKILQIGSSVRATSDQSGRMESVEQSQTIEDNNLTFAGQVEGSGGDKVRGSTASLSLAVLKVPLAQWPTVLSGIIHSYSLVAERRWQLILRPNDLPLRKFAPKCGIFQADWPNADASVLAQYGPLLYGQHDSSTTTAKGAVPLVYVDKSLFRYLLCWGRAQGVDAVYADGVKQASGWSVSYPVVGGRVCTLVTFTADQGTKAITADVRGYETVGDGTGTLIQTPTDVIRHLLANWVYNDYLTGNWFPETGVPIDKGTFNSTAAFFARANAKCARRILGAQRLGMDFLDEWAQTWQTRMFWTHGWNIGCRIEDYGHLGLYRDDQAGWIRYDQTPFTGPPTYAPEFEGLIDRVNIDYHFQEGAGKYLFSLEVRDPTRTFEAPDSIQLPWSSVTTY